VKINKEAEKYSFSVLIKLAHAGCSLRSFKVMW